MTKQPERSHAQEWEVIEQEHIDCCYWQAKMPRTLIECLKLKNLPQAVIVVKTFDGRTDGRKWPNHIGTDVYFPADDSNTWKGIDVALTELRGRLATKAA